MWNTLIIGLKNLWRRRLRTALTAGMIFIGTGLIVWSVGLAEGTYNDMIRLATQTYAGHFQVVKGDYKDKPSLFKTIDDPDLVIAELKKTKGVKSLTRRVETAGLLAHGEKTTGVGLIGVDPVTEAHVTSLHAAVTKGSWFKMYSGPSGTDEDQPIIIGDGVAARLGVGLNDEVSFVGQAADGSIAAQLFRIRGIIDSGTDSVDGVMAFIRLADAQDLLVLGRRVHRVVGLADSFKDAAAIGARVQLPPGLRFLPWNKVLPELQSTIRSDRSGLWFFLFIILIVVLLGVSNTMMMAVMERTREFGVMKALGASPRRIIGVIVCEAGWVTSLGVAAGLGAGMLANLATKTWGLRVMDEPITYGGVLIEVMRAENTMVGDVVFPALILICGLLAGLIPAIRAAHLNPAEAIRDV